MAKIQIKRSTENLAPNSALVAGEIAQSLVSGSSKYLYVGDGTNQIAVGSADVVKYYQPPVLSTLDTAPTINSTITSISGLVTVTVDTSAAHGLTAGEAVTISGTTNFNGTFTVTSTPDSDTFTISATGHATPESSGTVRPSGRRYIVGTSPAGWGNGRIQETWASTAISAGDVVESDGTGWVITADASAVGNGLTIYDLASGALKTRTSGTWQTQDATTTLQEAYTNGSDGVIRVDTAHDGGIVYASAGWDISAEPNGSVFTGVVTNLTATITSISGTGTVSVTTSAPHNLSTGMTVTISGTTNFNDTAAITVTGANTFTYSDAGNGTPESSGTVTAIGKASDAISAFLTPGAQVTRGVITAINQGTAVAAGYFANTGTIDSAAGVVSITHETSGSAVTGGGALHAYVGNASSQTANVSTTNSLAIFQARSASGGGTTTVGASVLNASSENAAIVTDSIAKFANNSTGAVVNVLNATNTGAAITGSVASIINTANATGMNSVLALNNANASVSVPVLEIANSGTGTEIKLQARTSDPYTTVAAISNISGTGTVTVDTATAHGLTAGQTITIIGTTNFNGQFTVATTPDTDTFTFSATGHATPETTGSVTIKLAGSVWYNNTTGELRTSNGTNTYRGAFIPTDDLATNDIIVYNGTDFDSTTTLAGNLTFSGSNSFSGSNELTSGSLTTGTNGVTLNGSTDTLSVGSVGTLSVGSSGSFTVAADATAFTYARTDFSAATGTTVVNKDYVDSVAAGLDIKESVHVGTIPGNNIPNYITDTNNTSVQNSNGTTPGYFGIPANQKTTGALTDLSFDAVNTINRTTGSFITDGFVKGGSITVATTSTLNDGTYTILSVTALEITITTSSLTIETAVAAGTSSVTQAISSFFTGGAGSAAVIDGHTLAAGDRVLVKDQTDQKENGIYEVYSIGSKGNPTGGTDAVLVRSYDHDGSPAAEVSGGNFVFVEQGTTNADTGWVITGNYTLTLDSSNIVWSQFTGAGSFTAGNGIGQSGSTIYLDYNEMLNDAAIATGDFVSFADITDSNTVKKRTAAQFIADLDIVSTTSITDGILTKTAADTYVGRTVTGTTNRVSVTNGNGVSGNPTIDIDTNYVGQTSITTLGTIATGTWQGTTVGVQYGGTGANLSATGGTSQIVKQSTAGGAFTVGTLTNAEIAGAGAALTKTDDTNVTLTLGGSAATALVNAASLTLGWSGQLSVGRGGTGTSSLTANSILIGNGTSAISGTTLTNGQLLIGSNSAAPVAATLTGGNGISITNGAGTITIDVDLKTNGGLVIETGQLAIDLGASSITGTLAVGDGGTGLTTFGGTNTLLYTTAADTLSSITTANNGTLITSASGVPSWATFSAGSTATTAVLGITTGGTVAFCDTIDGGLF